MGCRYALIIPHYRRKSRQINDIGSLFCIKETDTIVTRLTLRATNTIVRILRTLASHRFGKVVTTSTMCATITGYTLATSYTTLTILAIGTRLAISTADAILALAAISTTVTVVTINTVHTVHITVFIGNVVATIRINRCGTRNRFKVTVKKLIVVSSFIDRKLLLIGKTLKFLHRH